MDKDIVKKYKDKIIGRTNLNKELYVDEISDENLLKNFLYDMYDSGHKSLTKEGFEFLKEYYGLEEIAKLIFQEKDKGINYDFTSSNEVFTWLGKFKDFK